MTFSNRTVPLPHSAFTGSTTVHVHQGICIAILCKQPKCKDERTFLFKRYWTTVFKTAGFTFILVKSPISTCHYGAMIKRQSEVWLLTKLVGALPSYWVLLLQLTTGLALKSPRFIIFCLSFLLLRFKEDFKQYFYFIFCICYFYLQIMLY